MNVATSSTPIKSKALLTNLTSHVITGANPCNHVENLHKTEIWKNTSYLKVKGYCMILIRKKNTEKLCKLYLIDG